MTWRPLSIVPVWVGVVLLVAAVAVWIPPRDYAAALALVFAAAVFASFCSQLALQQKDGLVQRISISVVGALLLLVVATAVLLPLA